MFYGKKVYLRGIELSDADLIMKNFNNLELRMTLGGVNPASHEEEIEWIKSTWEGRKKGETFEFSICLLDDTWIGTTGLFAIDKQNRSAELGIAIHQKEHQGKGYGTDAIITLCGFGFRHLNLHSIHLKYFDFNIAGEKSYPKAGFQVTGREREVYFRDGVYRDMMRMDILASEWFEKFGKEYTLQKS